MSEKGTSSVALLKRSHLNALLAWEACAIGGHLILFASIGTHIWDRGDLIFLLYIAGVGVVIVLPIIFAAPRFEKVGAALVGMLIGVWPSVLGFAYVFIVRPGFEESAGTFAVAMMFAGPSAIGGAFAGVICSRRKAPLAVEHAARSDSAAFNP